MIFFISDYHINHDNIIVYANRPFSNVVEMNATLCRNWNNTVTDDDVVFFVGDFMMGNPIFCDPILNRLKGNKILIRGNHDSKSVAEASGWHKVLKEFEFKYEKYLFKLKHHPHKQEIVDDADILSTIFIHGHTHGYHGKINKNQIDVSCEVWDYTPVSIDDIIKTWENHILLFWEK